MSANADYKTIKFIKVDIDANSETAESQGISAMPTFKFFKKGEKVGEVVGADLDKIKVELNKLMA